MSSASMASLEGESAHIDQHQHIPMSRGDGWGTSARVVFPFST